MMQMTEMGDAQISGVEHENRVAVVARAAEFPHVVGTL